jgi:hypothetical protein
MTKDKDKQNRPQLRLVVNNAEKRNPRPTGSEEDIISLKELCAKRDVFRPDFYRGMDRWQAKAYEVLERFLARQKLPYGLDSRHGRLLVLSAGVFLAETGEPGGTSQDEVLIYVTEDVTGQGLCLSLEMLLPFYSEDEAVMEDVFLYVPVHQYGTLFLEENPRDGLLDLIYCLSFPLYPPALTSRLLARLFAIAVFELQETLRNLAEYQGE